MRKCVLCNLKSESIAEVRLRQTPTIEGVVDPNYEYDYNVPMCAECYARVTLAAAMAELEEADAIRAEAAERRERAQARVAFFMAQEEAEEEKAARRAAKEKEGEDDGTDPDDCF